MNNMNRRDFLRTASFGAMGLLIPGSVLGKNKPQFPIETHLEKDQRDKGITVDHQRIEKITRLCKYVISNYDKNKGDWYYRIKDPEKNPGSVEHIMATRVVEDYRYTIDLFNRDLEGAVKQETGKGISEIVLKFDPSRSDFIRCTGLDFYEGGGDFVSIYIRKNGTYGTATRTAFTDRGLIGKSNDIIRLPKDKKAANDLIKRVNGHGLSGEVLSNKIYDHTVDTLLKFYEKV